MMRVDLNSDLGESFGAYSIGMDADVIQFVTSVNAACGYHAGDPLVMEKTVRLAKQYGVAVGAHPGYPDLQGFGRRSLNMSPDEVRTAVMYQIGALQAFLNAEGMHLQHVKPHGALYNDAAVKPELAKAIAEAVRAAAPDAILLGLAGSCLLTEAEKLGLKTASEVFADRAYNDDGTLVSRRLPGAVLHDPDEAIARTIRMVREGVVESITGRLISICADSVCVHGDNPSAVAFVSRIRRELEAAGVRVAALSAE